MAATYSQLPGDLNIACVRGDELNFSITFTGIDLTGYTLSSAVYRIVSAAVTTVIEPSLSLGVEDGNSVIAISMTETQTNLLSATATLRWYLRWETPGGVTRTVLAGAVTAKNP